MPDTTALRRPWLDSVPGLMGDLPIAATTMAGLLDAAKEKHPQLPAIDYLGKKITYAALIKEVDHCAAALLQLGVKQGDSVMVSLPNIPGAIVLLYALNRLGVRACFSHPLSSTSELEHYITTTGSRLAFTLDMFFGRFAPILKKGLIDRLVIAKISDHLPPLTKTAYYITKGRKTRALPALDTLTYWKDFMAAGKAAVPAAWPEVNADAAAVVLFSGGTTSLPKGILLSSRNFNALAAGAGYITKLQPGDSVLAILPVFHGFGLGLCVHTCMCGGVKVVLIPEFSAKNYIANLKRHNPSFIAGVPTLFEALLRDEKFAAVSFSHLKGAYCGGDSLTPSLKRRFDERLKAQGSRVELEEGYGLTETVTACMISPAGRYKEGSMGVPLPNVFAKVVAPGTERELPFGEEGEICVAGPQNMLGYLGDEEATAQTLRRHADGQTWLHTGDLGLMDEEGYFFFKNRIKRILKISGMSVYPAQIEQLLEAHPLVSRACAIGVPDDYQMTSLKAFVTLRPGNEDKDPAAVVAELMDYCKKHLIKWSAPRQIELRDQLPTTLVGKVAYVELEREELAKAEKK